MLPRAGLLLTGRGGVEGRSDERRLGALWVGPEGLVHDTIPLADVRGSGAPCQDFEGLGDRDGYCVALTGTARATRLVAPGCLEQRPGARWTAVRVRVGDVWLGEAIAPARPCARTLRVARGRFSERPCGPETELRRCADADFALE